MHTCMDVRTYKRVHVQRLSKRYRLVKKSLIHRRIESCDQARWWTSARWGKSLKMGKRMPRLQPYSTTNALISLSLVLLLARYFFYKHTPIGTLNEERVCRKRNSSTRWSLRSTLPAHFSSSIANLFYLLDMSFSMISRSKNCRSFSCVFYSRDLEC